MKQPFILTNHKGGDRSETWGRMAKYIEYKKYTPFYSINSFINAYRLFRLRKHYDAVVLGGNARADTFYLLFQRLCPFLKRPIVKNECLWNKGNPIVHRLKRILFQFLDPVVSRYIVYSRSEIDVFSQMFGLPREKFQFIHYHNTLESGDLVLRQGEYVFSGGNSNRDYSQLAEAVDGLDVRVVIACSDPRLLQNLTFTRNVELVSVSREEFRRLMAESGTNVVALRKGLLRSAGHQTFLNAMTMGKPVIVTDPEGAKDYIKDGVDGILVPPDDPDALRAAILKLQEEPGFALRLGQAAMKKAEKWDTETHLSATASLAKCFI
jgi:glycosyltransferase involved in cell wall biosynthesis